MIRALISTSQVKDGELILEISDEVYSAMTTLRQFLYDYVYRSPRVHQDFEKAKKMLSELYAYFLENEELLHQKVDELNARFAELVTPEVEAEVEAGEFVRPDPRWDSSSN